MSGKVKPEEAVQATLSSLPDEVVDTVQVTSLPSEDALAEKKRKLEFLEMEEELIKVKFASSIVLTDSVNEKLIRQVNGNTLMQVNDIVN